MAQFLAAANKQPQARGKQRRGALVQTSFATAPGVAIGRSIPTVIHTSNQAGLITNVSCYVEKPRIDWQVRRPGNRTFQAFA
jgi:hypothetical protein